MIDMVYPATTNSAIALAFIVEATVHSSGAIPMLTTRVPTPHTTPTQKRARASKPNGIRTEIYNKKSSFVGVQNTPQDARMPFRHRAR
jgi:hypothetical protein